VHTVKLRSWDISEIKEYYIMRVAGSIHFPEDIPKELKKERLRRSKSEYGNKKRREDTK
jgi:hypothetical protein